MGFAVPLDFLRGVGAEFRPDAWAVSRATDTSSGDGTSSSWATVASGSTGCRISTRSASAGEAVGGDQGIRAVGNRIVWLPALTDVTPRDRIVCGARTFEVLDVQARSFEVERACICVEIA